MLRSFASHAPQIGARVSFRKPPNTFLLRTMSTSSKPTWATVDPASMGTNPEPYAVSNLVGGKWVHADATMTIPHPLDKTAHPIFTVPDTQVDELGPFFESLRKVTKSGVHNPLKNPERYVQYGEISRKVCLAFFFFY
jgi:1-pyrroline-5-carboxylate dehydrogenase